MTSITKQPNGWLSLKWVRKHLYEGSSTTSPHTEGSSQKDPCQCYGHKVVRSVRSNRFSPGTVDDQTEPETTHEETYQYHQPPDKIRVNTMPGPEETNESIKPRLQKKQHLAFLFPIKLQQLEPSLPPPQNKPLPEIPTQTLPRKLPDRVGQKVQDPRPPARNSPNTTRKTIANYSLFPKLAVKPPPRSSSLQQSSRPYGKAHKSQGLPCANTTVTKQLHRHVAELYRGPSMERENTVKELRDIPIEELLPRITRSSSFQKSVIGSKT
ncbi:uncharacterized protein B0J16DRAFT_252996, partial [Fusarium flagelliforme]|uniref:uncharacterized protein n=1 Tax=Fusarium flagelliforme TaxID=2675880 RepID=UPI001E8D4D5C